MLIDQPKEESSMLKTDIFTPSRFVGEGTVTLRGVKVPYHTVSEDNVFMTMMENLLLLYFHILISVPMWQPKT